MMRDQETLKLNELWARAKHLDSISLLPTALDLWYRLRGWT
jgi:hypothetical protein